jgi:hypothetical protein
MKVMFTTIAFAALFFADRIAFVQSRERSLKSEKNEVEGEAIIKDGDCKMECEWKAKEDRRLSRVNTIARTLITVGKDHRKLGVELKDVECKVTIGHDQFIKEIEFPTGWVQIIQKADGADDYYGFSTSFTVRMNFQFLSVCQLFVWICSALIIFFLFV